MTNAELDALPRNAIISACGLYRYVLTCTWDANLPMVGFASLNPSRADATVNDPTFRKVTRYGMAWGYGSICMLNCFAFRATDPAEMLAAADPVGPENDFWIRTMAAECAEVVASWGPPAAHLQRGAEMRGLLGPNLKCLWLTKDGWPGHPLYLASDLTPLSF